MKTPIAARLTQLKAYVPQLFPSPGTLLYVGANHKRSHYLAELARAGHEVTLLEIFAKNVELYLNCPWLRARIHGDVRDPAAFVGRRWDVAFWWHGPEHVKREELGQALTNLENHTSLVVAGCPFGLFEQKVVFGNPNEAHSGTYYPIDFECLGYEVVTMGSVDVRSSNILAWKECNHVN